MRQYKLCKRPISGCFGFVRARDYLEFLEGKRKRVGELCGICVEKVLRRYLKIPKGELF